MFLSFDAISDVKIVQFLRGQSKQLNETNGAMPFTFLEITYNYERKGIKIYTFKAILFLWDVFE